MRKKCVWVFVVMLLTGNFCGCAYSNIQQMSVKENVTQAVEGADTIRHIEFRLEYPQAMWQMTDLGYAEFQNQEEFEKKFYEAVEKIIEITGYKDWYKQYNPDMQYARVLIKIADMGYISVGGKCDRPSEDTTKGIFTTIYLDKKMIAVGGQILAHELTHFLCGTSFSFSLADGLAEYCDRAVTGRSSNYSSYPIDDYLKAMEILYQEQEEFQEKIWHEVMDSVGRAGQFYPYENDSLRSPLWYAYSESFVSWMIQTYGMENVMDLYREGASETDYEWLEEGGFDAVKEKWYDYYDQYQPRYDYDTIFEEQMELRDRWREIRGENINE